MSEYQEFYYGKPTDCIQCGQVHLGTCSEGKYVDNFTCRFCGDILDSMEVEENKKPIPYAAKPICYKCAWNRV